jgi:hypothetical protein
MNRLLSNLVADSEFAPLGRDAGPGGSNAPGLICAANEARFTSANFSEPLTAYAVGFRDPERIDIILDELFPAVEVNRRFEFKKADNAEEFFSETDDVRQIGSAFKKVSYKGSSVNEKTLNKGLTVSVDHDEEPDGNFQQKYVGRLLRRLMRNDLRRAISVLDGASTNANKVWGAASNPDGDIRAALGLGADATGIRPNVVLFGESATDLRLDVYEAQDTPYAGRAAAMTQEQLAQKYMVDLVRTLKARYQSAAAAKSKVLAGVVYAYLAEQGVGPEDPTNVKRFVTPTSSGRFRVYINERDKFTDITVEHYSNTVITSSAGIRKLTVTAS